MVPDAESIASSENILVQHDRRRVYLQYLEALSRGFPQIGLVRHQPKIQKAVRVSFLRSSFPRNPDIESGVNVVLRFHPDWFTTSNAVLRSRDIYVQRQIDHIPAVLVNDEPVRPSMVNNETTRFKMISASRARNKVVWFQRVMKRLESLSPPSRPASLLSVPSKAKYSSARSELDIVLSEGLDFNVICALGLHYQVNPEFFARHLLDSKYDGIPQIQPGKWTKPASDSHEMQTYRFKWLRPDTISADHYQLMLKSLSSKHYWTSFV